MLQNKVDYSHDRPPVPANSWSFCLLSLSEALQVLQDTKVSDLRECDQVELRDAFHPAIPNHEITPEDIALCMGMINPTTRIVLLKDKLGPIFIGCSSCEEGGTRKLLTGFAWREGEARLSKKEKLEAVYRLSSCLMLDDPSKPSEWVCYCHPDNTATLNGWRLLGRDHTHLSVSIVEYLLGGPFRGYKEIRVHYLF